MGGEGEDGREQRYRGQEVRYSGDGGGGGGERSFGTVDSKEVGGHIHVSGGPSAVGQWFELQCEFGVCVCVSCVGMDDIVEKRHR